MSSTVISDEKESLWQSLANRFGDGTLQPQKMQDGIPTFWVSPDKFREVLRVLKTEVDRPFRLLYDVSAIDERLHRVEFREIGDEALYGVKDQSD